MRAHGRPRSALRPTHPAPDASFDVVVLTQVLEHVRRRTRRKPHVLGTLESERETIERSSVKPVRGDHVAVVMRAAQRAGAHTELPEQLVVTQTAYAAEAQQRALTAAVRLALT
jgi:hypothetical protein